MYSKLMDLYTFDITETRHIHCMVCVITQIILKILYNYWKTREGYTNPWKYFVESINNGVIIEQEDKGTSITLKNVALENFIKL